ncbi:MAG: hypothetical protein JNG88_03940 [Phycisphaerales bacterium]|nr:hypothetical protein [Phycisphaerales bacterium]
MARGSRAGFVRPELLLVLTFAGLIFSGAMLLKLPQAEKSPVRFIDALFTSTSAVCVTGLTTVDTEQTWTRSGHAVIMVLIQLGGLGVMTFTALAATILNRPVSFNASLALHDAFFDSDARAELGKSLRKIVGITLAIELIGAVVIYVGLTTHENPRGDWFDALFLAVSAFCNAGFSPYSENLVGVRGSLPVVWAIMLLITLGGIGYTVLIEATSRLRRFLFRMRQQTVLWSLHTRVVVAFSAVLVFGGAAGVYFAGLGPEKLNLGPRVLHALFQSVTARTAGFNTIDIAAMPVSSLMVIILLMFIGGSPGSTAGGIKTTAAAVWGKSVNARLQGASEVNMFRRRVPDDLVRRAELVVAMALIWNAVGVFMLAITEAGRGTPFERLVFEQISAFCTVGLSANVTMTLSDAGKLWIIMSMFVGRLGTLTIMFFVVRPNRVRYQLPQERLMIG